MTLDERFDDHKPRESVCGQGNLLWIIVLLLLLGLGGFNTIGAVMGAVGLPSTAVAAMLVLGAYCALLLAGLLIAGLGLKLAYCCLGDLARAKYAAEVDPVMPQRQNKGR